ADRGQAVQLGQRAGEQRDRGARAPAAPQAGRIGGAHGARCRLLRSGGTGRRMKAAGTPTLTRHLLGWALAALTVVWATFIVFGYRTGEHEADEQTDGHLASVSSLLLPLAPGGLQADATPPVL